MVGFRFFEGRHFINVIEMCHRLVLVAMVMNIRDSKSNNEIIVESTAKGQTACSTEHSLSLGTVENHGKKW